MEKGDGGDGETGNERSNVNFSLYSWQELDPNLEEHLHGRLEGVHFQEVCGRPVLLH